MAKWTDKIVKRICDGMRDGLSMKSACQREGMSPSTLSSYISGDEPRNPKWAAWAYSARADCIAGWIEKLERYADEGNNAGVKAAEKMLFALDNRFRGEYARGAGGQGVVINITQADPKELDAKVVDVQTEGGDQQLALPSVDAE